MMKQFGCIWKWCSKTRQVSPRHITASVGSMRDVGEIEQAIDAQQQAIGEEPDFADAHYHLGVLYSRGQDWHAATDAYQRAVCLSTDDAECLLPTRPMLSADRGYTGSRKSDAAVSCLKVRGCGSPKAH